MNPSKFEVVFFLVKDFLAFLSFLHWVRLLGFHSRILCFFLPLPLVLFIYNRRTTKNLQEKENKTSGFFLNTFLFGVVFHTKFTGLVLRFLHTMPGGE